MPVDNSVLREPNNNYIEYLQKESKFYEKQIEKLLLKIRDRNSKLDSKYITSHPSEYSKPLTSK